jgi:integrase
LQKLKEEKRGTVKVESASNIVFEFMQRYIDDNKTSRQPGSLSVYKSVKNHLQNYCKTSGVRVSFDSIDSNFFKSFQKYLSDVVGLNNTTIAKQLSTIKTFLGYAKIQGIVVSDRYKDFKIKRPKLGVIALTNEEFETLYNIDLSHNKRLAETRDVFCFACTTGLRYSDLFQLKREHIKKDEIKLTVKKTGEPLTIPLTSYSKAILAKYEGMHKPLPVISNQNLNYSIKELCKYAEINEPIEVVQKRGIKREENIKPKYELITVHVARKTFCTLSLEKGMSAEQVMKVSGHLDYRSFSRYVNVTEQLKKVVMLKAWSGGNSSESKFKAV